MGCEAVMTTVACGMLIRKGVGKRSPGRRKGINLEENIMMNGAFADLCFVACNGV